MESFDTDADPQRLIDQLVALGYRVFKPGDPGLWEMARVLRAEGYNVLPVDSKEPLSDFERAVRLLTCGLPDRGRMSYLLGWTRGNGLRTRALNALEGNNRDDWWQIKSRAREIPALQGVSEYSMVWVLCTMLERDGFQGFWHMAAKSANELLAGLDALEIPVPLPVDHPAAVEAIRRLRAGERPR